MAQITRSAVLYILQSGDTYTVSLETPTESPSVLAATISISAEDRRDVLTALERVMGPVPSPEPFEPEALSSLGQLMYRLFLPRSIQDFLRAWEGPLIISTNDPAIPWELLHDGDAFLGVKHAVGRRLISGRTPPSRASTRPRRPAFLFIADPRGDLAGAAEEAKHLVAILSKRGFPCDLLLGERASYLNVQEALGTGRYDVIHYAGHARFGGVDGEESALELAQNRLLPASQIERVLRGTPLVFLNACSSGRTERQNTAPAPLAYLGGVAESLASAFIFGGAQGFIGALWPVHDAGSRAFAAYFYDRVLAGDPVGEALRATRHHVRQERPAEATWASFVLYGDPTYRLWEGMAAAQPTKTPTPSAPVRRIGAAQRAGPAAVPGPVTNRREGSISERGGRLRTAVVVFAVLIVAGLVGAFGWWTRPRRSGVEVQEEPTRPVALAAEVATETPTATVTASPSPGATASRPPPTSTSTPQPSATPTPQPTATESPAPQTVRGWLAFVSKPQSGLSTLYLMNADGSGLRELGPGADPEWSPAGDRIAFAGLLEDRPGIFLINPDGTGRTRLTDTSDWQPTWSPDGRRIAFMSLRDGDREIYVMNADGSGLQRISNNPWQDRHPSWSPRGDKIAFISNRSGRWQVWVMNADGSNQVRLTDNDYDNYRPVWSPDGRRIAFGVWTGTRNEVWVMDADGSNPHMVTANAVYKQEFEGYGLAWAPGHLISFVSDRDGLPQIYVTDADGRAQRAVTAMPRGAWSPAWLSR